MQRFFIFLILSAAACKTLQPVVKESKNAITAESELQPLLGARAHGKVTFVEQSTGVRITGRIEGLPPLTQHGFHVHEKGDCSAPDGSSAGGHFNPNDTMHGAPHDATAHAGDLGNIMSDNFGVATFDIFKPGVALSSQTQTFIGRSLIVHAQADDLTSQPVGNAGARIACGVIARKK